MELRTLHYFLAVAREENMTEAANVLHVTQPTLSHHMKILADSGLVDYYKEGKWMRYSISADGVREFREMIASYARCDCETDGSISCGCEKKK